MNRFFKLFALVVLMITFSFGHNGEKKIRLSGKIKESTPNRITVKNIEKDLKYYQYNIYNPYEKKENLYGGILLNEFIKKYGTKDVSLVKIKAIDDYEVSFSKNEWSSTRILLSTKVDKKYIGFKDKGPMRIAFPDYDPKLQKCKDNMPKWMWMINKIEFR